MNTLSVVISAYNEEQHINDCLLSVQWADEIIVIDNSSTDKTAVIAKKYGAQVYTEKNNPMLNINKNKGFDKANSDWILNLDADERVSEELASEIKKVLADSPQFEGYKMPRKNIIFGKWVKHGLWWPDYQIRLFRKGKGAFPCVHVHEYIKIDGSIGTLTSTLEHLNYETIYQYIVKLNTIYTENEVENKIKEIHSVHWYDALRFPVRDFLTVYFAREGYKDGYHGFMLACLQGVYAFVVFAKIWERKGFENISFSQDELQKEVHTLSREYMYWYFQTKISSAKDTYHKIIFKLRRKMYT